MRMKAKKIALCGINANEPFYLHFAEFINKGQSPFFMACNHTDTKSKFWKFSLRKLLKIKKCKN